MMLVNLKFNYINNNVKLYYLICYNGFTFVKGYRSEIS